jgi:hypothetical protein
MYESLLQVPLAIHFLSTRMFAKSEFILAIHFGSFSHFNYSSQGDLAVKC